MRHQPLHDAHTVGLLLWEGISLAEAVKCWLGLSTDAQILVTIFGTDTHSGAQLAQLALRADFPTAG
jgi:hypothetical protein